MMLLCTGCRKPITDRFLLNVLESRWHIHCVRCTECNQPLSDRCFARDDKIYCHKDFFRRFGTKCVGCNQGISPNDLVRRAQGNVFHVNCFKCSVCRKKLSTGEELYVMDENKIVCKNDFVIQDGDIQKLITDSCTELRQNKADNAYKTSDISRESKTLIDDKPDSISMKRIPESSHSPRKTKDLSKNVSSVKDFPVTPSLSPLCAESDETDLKNECDSTSKELCPTVVKRRGPRTTIKTGQLDALRSAFITTPKPSRHVREKLADETGLSMRVIQVWFQNRRSKERRVKLLSAIGACRPGFHYAHNACDQTSDFSDNNFNYIQSQQLNFLSGSSGSQVQFLKGNKSVCNNEYTTVCSKERQSIYLRQLHNEGQPRLW